MLTPGEIHSADKGLIWLHVCACRMRKRSGGGSRRTSRLQWWWPMTLRWKLSRSCVLSGDSCRRNRIAVPSFLQTWRPCRESGNIPVIFLFLSPVPPTPATPVNREDLGSFPQGTAISNKNVFSIISSLRGFKISYQNRKTCVRVETGSSTSLSSWDLAALAVNLQSPAVFLPVCFSP